MKTIGIMGGSFNPVHCGHLMVASYIRQRAGLDEVWLMLSPMNPLKSHDGMVADEQRMEMLRIGVGDGADRIKASDVELTIPRPSYTINTLKVLRERYADVKFKLIIGSDNWLIFDKWRDYRAIIEEFGVIVYPRPGYEIEQETPQGVETVDAPRIEISSTMIRDSIADGMDMRRFVPGEVWQYIKDNNLYIG